MANALGLTDGTTTIALSSSGCVLTDYMPNAPEYDAANGAYKTVTEAVEFVIVESSVALVQAKVTALELLLQRCRWAAKGTGPRVYLTFQAGADAAALRSEVLNYRLELGADAAVGLYQQRLECRLLLTRQYFWEWPEVELQLSTSSQAAATGGRTVLNHDDSDADNWVQIAAAQVTGALPAACRVQVTNNIGGARQFSKIYLALNALSDPANFAHVLEGEASGGSTVSNAAYSNGQALSLTVGSGGSPTSSTFVWALSASLLQRAAGRPFRLLARFVDGSGTVTCRPEVRDAGGIGVLWRGDAVGLPASGGGIVDLGVCPLPPGGYSASYGAATLALTFRGIGARTLDFVQLTPTDGLVLLECSAAVAASDVVVYDGIEKRSYVLNGSSQLSYVSAGGGDLLLLPNTTQRLILLEENLTGTSQGAAADAFSVRAWYRPRRTTV